MISRYARPEMARIWTQDAKYEAWLQVELAVCEVYARRGLIPVDALGRITTLNRAAARMFGIAEAAAIGRLLEEVCLAGRLLLRHAAVGHRHEVLGHHVHPGSDAAGDHVAVGVDPRLVRSEQAGIHPALNQ